MMSARELEKAILQWSQLEGLLPLPVGCAPLQWLLRVLADEGAIHELQVIQSYFAFGGPAGARSLTLQLRTR